MRIVIFTAWGGLFPIPILNQLLGNDSIEVVKIYTQGIHWKRIKEYHPSYYLNYKDNVAAMIERKEYSDFEIIISANQPEVVQFIKENSIDCIFTIGYGEILEKGVINAPKKGIINFHPGLLPENKGADPFASSIFNNEFKTGVTFHYIDEGIDTGDIIYRKEIECLKSDNYDLLQLKIGIQATIELNEFIKSLIEEKSLRIGQKKGDGSYFNKLKNSQRLFNFRMNGQEICRIVNTFSGGNGKSYFQFLSHKIYVGSCEFIENKVSYEKTDLVDQGLGYLVVACSDGLVLLKSLFVDDLTLDLSNQLLNELFHKGVKDIN